MKIVVLAGGISTEREVSIVSGTNVCKALREIGHDAILMDVYFGDEEKNPDNAFQGAAYDMESDLEKIKAHSAHLEEELEKGGEFFGPNVLPICQSCDIVFLALHGENGEINETNRYEPIFRRDKEEKNLCHCEPPGCR